MRRAIRRFTTTTAPSRSTSRVALARPSSRAGSLWWPWRSASGEHNRSSTLAQPGAAQRRLGKHDRRCEGDARGRSAATDKAVRGDLEHRPAADPDLPSVGASVSPALSQDAGAHLPAARLGRPCAAEGHHRQPTTLGIGEPFTIVVTCLPVRARLLLSRSVPAHQSTSHILPANSATKRAQRLWLPVLLAVPFLFRGRPCCSGFEIVAARGRSTIRRA